MENAFNKRAGGSGSYMMEKMMEGTAFAGTGTPQELVELEKNLRQLIQVKMYPYSYLEKYLVSQGYQQSDIRNVFKTITGVPVEDFLSDNSNMMSTPAAIPSYNMGWGEAKGSKFDYLFIMPWVAGYSIFGQKGDFHREEISNHPVLAEAREEIMGKVKEYHQHDNVVNLDMDKPKENHFSGFSEPKFSALSAEGRSVEEYMAMLGTDKNPIAASAYVKDAYFNGLISKPDFVILSARYIKAAEEKEKAAEDKASAKDDVKTLADKADAALLDDVIKEDSPQAFFDAEVGKDKVDNLTPFLESIGEYLAAKSAEVAPQYIFSLKSFKYQAVDKFEAHEKNVNTSSSKPVEMLNSSGVIAIMLNVGSAKLSKDAAKKFAYMVFSVIDGALQTTGTFKGTDGKVYALSKEGMEKYFGDAEDKNDIKIF
jgi:hypothetical protein